MDDLLSEKEQLEQMRTWWSEYGNYVIAGIVLGALGLFGYNYFQSSQLDEQLGASSLYQDLTDEVVDGDLEQAEILAGQILSDDPDSAYAAQTSLAMARLYMDKNRDQDAAEQHGTPLTDQPIGYEASRQSQQIGRRRVEAVDRTSEKRDHYQH